MRRPDIQNGYTLIELLSVLAIMGLIVAVATPSISSAIASAKFKFGEDILLTSLRACRSEAIRTQSSVILDTPDAIARVARIDASRLQEAAKLQVDRPVRCFPDGTTSGGKLTLTDNGRTKVFSISWLTGITSTE